MFNISFCGLYLFWGDIILIPRKKLYLTSVHLGFFNQWNVYIYMYLRKAGLTGLKQGSFSYLKHLLHPQPRKWWVLLLWSNLKDRLLMYIPALYAVVMLHVRVGAVQHHKHRTFTLHLYITFIHNIYTLHFKNFLMIPYNVIDFWQLADFSCDRYVFSVKDAQRFFNC